MINRNQLIALPNKQLEAVAVHLEQTVAEIRKLNALQAGQPFLLDSADSIELVLDSTDSLVRVLKKQPKVLAGIEPTIELLERRTGRRRRAKRRGD